MNKETAKVYALVTTFFYEIVISMGLGFGIGYLIDRFFHQNHLFSIIFMFLGLIGVFFKFIKNAIKVMSDDNE